MTTTTESPTTATALLDGARMVRLEWRMGGESGHGDWFHVDDRPMLEAHVIAHNRTYGPGTHWIAERPLYGRE